MVLSLRRQLTIILIGLTLVIWVLAMIITAVIAQVLIYHQIERQLEHYMDMTQYTSREILGNKQISRYFWGRSETLQNDAGLTRVTAFGSRGVEQGTNLWFNDRHILIGEFTPRFPPPEQEGIITVSFGKGDKVQSGRWRILYRYEPSEDLWIGVGVNMEYTENFGTVSFWRALLPLCILLPLVTAVLLWGVGRGLKPLHMLAASIASRKPSALEPIDLAEVPAEIKPVVSELNNLLERLKRALISEQRFTSNAAHELRTPLAAIKAEVQLCQRQANDETVHQMLARIAQRVSRTTDTVEQLLTLARLEPDQEFSCSPIDFNRQLMDVVAEFGVIALERKIDIHLDEVEESAVVTGNVEWMNILLRNLLLNALMNSPSPGEVSISLRKIGKRVVLAIANDCEPIADEDFARLTDRFYRPEGSPQRGLGLGLSIVQRIVELHGADLVLSRWQNERGFKVEVNLTST